MTAQRRMINKVRTDFLEQKIAHYRATGAYDAAEAIEALARSICAPICEYTIVEEARQRRKFYEEARQ